MSQFWGRKKIIVTGGAGMVGSYLCPMLRDAGATVVVLDDFSKGRNKMEGVSYIEADAGEIDTCQRVFDGAFVVFNLAASVGGVYFNLNNQASQFYENLRLQTVPVLAIAQMSPSVRPRRFLQVSSVCVYSKGYNAPAKEAFGHFGEPEPANAGYAWAKRMGEKVTAWALQNIHYSVVRPTNMYGERDYFDERAHVIPALIGKFTENQDKAVIFGGKQSREFLHAEDGARAMMFVAQHGGHDQVYNVGTGSETRVTIADLASVISILTGSNAKIEYDAMAGAGDAHRSTDVSKLESLGWKHKIPLEDGLDCVVKWYQQHHHRDTVGL